MENIGRVFLLRALTETNQPTGGFTKWIGIPYPSKAAKVFFNTYRSYCTGQNHPTLDRFTIHLMEQFFKDPIGALLLGATTVWLSLKIHKLAGPFLALSTLLVLYRNIPSNNIKKVPFAFAKNPPPRSQINSGVRNTNTLVPLKGAPSVDYKTPFLSTRNDLLTIIIKLLPSAKTTQASRGNGIMMPKQQIDILTHAHRIFECVFLGDWRAFLSIDPRFIQEYPAEFQDSREKTYGGDDEPLIQEQINQYEAELDHRGSTDLGFTRVISVTAFDPKNTLKGEDSAWASFNPDISSINRIQIGVDDDDSFVNVIIPHLEQICNAIDAARIEGKPILIHCVKGASRSATVLILYLMRTLNVSFNQALNFLQTFRSQVDIKPTIQKQIKDWASAKKNSPQSDASDLREEKK